MGSDWTLDENDHFELGADFLGLNASPYNMKRLVVICSYINIIQLNKCPQNRLYTDMHSDMNKKVLHFVSNGTAAETLISSQQTTRNGAADCECRTNPAARSDIRVRF